MYKRMLALVFVFIILLAGCATMSGWTPVVDTYGDSNLGRIARDRAECRELALQSSGSGTENVLKGTAIGGALGAAAGAAIGAATGDPGTGAAIGAATGGIGGGTYEGLSTNSRFKESFRRCLTARGHRVLN